MRPEQPQKDHVPEDMGQANVNENACQEGDKVRVIGDQSPAGESGSIGVSGRAGEAVRENVQPDERIRHPGYAPPAPVGAVGKRQANGYQEDHKRVL